MKMIKTYISWKVQASVHLAKSAKQPEFSDNSIGDCLFFARDCVYHGNPEFSFIFAGAAIGTLQSQSNFTVHFSRHGC